MQFLAAGVGTDRSSDSECSFRNASVSNGIVPGGSLAQLPPTLLLLLLRVKEAGRPKAPASPAGRPANAALNCDAKLDDVFRRSLPAVPEPPAASGDPLCTACQPCCTAVPLSCTAGAPYTVAAATGLPPATSSVLPQPSRSLTGDLTSCRGGGGCALQQVW